MHGARAWRVRGFYRKFCDGDAVSPGDRSKGCVVHPGFSLLPCDDATMSNVQLLRKGNKLPALGEAPGTQVRSDGEFLCHTDILALKPRENTDREPTKGLDQIVVIHDKTAAMSQPLPPQSGESVASARLHLSGNEDGSATNSAQVGVARNSLSSTCRRVAAKSHSNAEFGLSDLRPATVGLGRYMHGRLARSPLSFTRRALKVGTEIARAAILDQLQPARNKCIRLEVGARPICGTSLAIYAHWSPTGQVSPMVLRQIDAWWAENFNVIFVSNSYIRPPELDLLKHLCSIILQRENIGYDFGAWADGISTAKKFNVTLNEILLINDSVVGPLRPLSPLVAAMRSGGAGLFGLTESRAGGTHLQSYVLMARGHRAVADLTSHLTSLAPTRSKWLLVQRGEIGLTRKMLSLGHRVAAVFGHDRVGSALSPADLQKFGRRFSEAGAYDRYPLNPTHHFWRILVEELGFPFLKTELIRHHSKAIPGAVDWREIVPPADLPMIEQHLAIMSEARVGASNSARGYVTADPQ